MKKSLLLIIFLFLFVTPAMAGVGDPAAPFTKNTLEHGQFNLDDHAGKVIYMFFVGYN